jgi:hypothetical protein
MNNWNWKKYLDLTQYPSDIWLEEACDDCLVYNTELSTYVAGVRQDLNLQSEETYEGADLLQFPLTIDFMRDWAKAHGVNENTVRFYTYGGDFQISYWMEGRKQ